MTASVTVTNSGDGLSARATAAAALASVAHSLLLSTATASASASSDVGPIEAIYDGFDDVPAATTVDFVVGGNRKANNNHNNSINRNSHNNYNNRERSQALYMQVVNFLQRGHGDSGDDYGGGSSNGNSNSNSNNNYNYSHMGSAYSGNNPNNHGNNNSNNNNMSFAYDEAEAEAINRSLLLLTTTAAGASSATATATSSLTLEENATRLFGSGLGLGLGLEPGPGPEEAADGGEWSHFYDLMLSWQGICLIAVFCTFIVITIIGNTLVILAVITTRRLKTVTNCFVMSLAVADLLVGIFVMPPAVAVHLIGSWQLGWVLCDIWISLDVLLCTASILSLCAISVDRYLAVTQPLTYSRKRRSKRLALIMILIVWVLALAITCPPMFGWYEPGRRDLSECRYNQNEGYVIFSAMGSFFIPMAVMIYVYARISCVVAARHDNMTDISVHNKKFKRYTATNVENDVDHDLSEQELSSGHKKQVAARTLSNQTLAKDLHEVEILSEGENGAGGAGGGGGVSVSVGVGGHCSLLAISTANAKNGCYELTRPASLKRPPTASSTMTTLAGEQHWTFGGALLQPPPQSHSHSQSQSQSRPHSMRHHHGGGGILVASPLLDGTAPASYTTRNTRVHHHQHHHQHSKTLSNRITSLKKENKTTQTLSIVVGGFIACWLPFFVYYLITPFLEEHQVSRPLAKMLTWLGWFNSAINPFIYAFYSVDFRAAFWRLTCKRFFSGSTKPQFPTNTMSIRR